MLIGTRKLAVCSLLVLLTFGCASAPDRTPPPPNLDTTWVVAETLPPSRSNILIRYCIENVDGRWQRRDTCNLQNDNVEALLLDPMSKKIFLGASAPSNKNLSVDERRRQRENPAAATDWECFYGAFGTADRAKFGYTVCGSQLTKGATGVGSAVIGNMFNILAGTVRKRIVINKDAVLLAAGQADLFVESYRAVYTKAKSSKDFAAFIARYQGNDPDNLIPRATDAMIRLRQVEAAQTAERQKQLADQRHEEQEKRLLESRERERRLSAWRQRAKIGDKCWVGPRQYSYHRQTMLRALIIGKQESLFRVQYDGRTNTDMFITFNSREEWVKRNEIFPETEYTVGTGTTVLKPNM